MGNCGTKKPVKKLPQTENPSNDATFKPAKAGRKANVYKLIKVMCSQEEFIFQKVEPTQELKTLFEAEKLQSANYSFIYNGQEITNFNVTVESVCGSDFEGTHVFTEVPHQRELDLTGKTQYSPIIGRPIFEESFKVVKFNVEDKIMTISELSSPTLTEIPEMSTYVNVSGSIYLSGGEKSHIQTERVEGDEEKQEPANSYLDTIHRIDLNDLTVEELPRLKKPRSFHSIVFLEPSYLVLVGGKGTNTTEIVDLKTKESFLDAEMNEEHCEPTLVLLNNSKLFVFYGFINYTDYSNTIEVIDYSDKKRHFDIFTLNESSVSCDLRFFAAVTISSSEIIFLGGTDIRNKDLTYSQNEEKCYTFDSDKGTLAIREAKVHEVSKHFTEKEFTKHGDYFAVINDLNEAILCSKDLEFNVFLYEEDDDLSSSA